MSYWSSIKTHRQTANEANCSNEHTNQSSVYYLHE